MSLFSLPLPETVLSSAEIESQDYLLDSLKAEQVYLSHLASYVVRYYFKLCGYAVTEPADSTLDFVGRALSDSTTLEIAGYGHFACMVIPFNAAELAVPTIALSTPAGYIAVEFDDELTGATIAGFLPQTDEASVALSDLKSLAELPSYLTQLNPVISAATQLSRWWNRSIERDWTLVSSMATGAEAEPQLAFRSREPEAATVEDSDLSIEALPTDGLICRKTLSLRNTGSTFSLTLMMERFERGDQSVNVLARLSPNLGQEYLPADVELTAADQSLAPFSSMRSREQSPFVELRFRASPGDYFKLTVAFEGIVLSEDFVV